MKKISKKIISSKGIRLSTKDGKQETGRIYLYLLYNDLHPEPVGYLEDLFINEKYRGQGIGTELIQQLVKEAKKHKCYKIVATSRKARPKVHKLYQKLGFEKRGYEFRMNLK